MFMISITLMYILFAHFIIFEKRLTDLRINNEMLVENINNSKSMNLLLQSQIDEMNTALYTKSVQNAQLQTEFQISKEECSADIEQLRSTTIQLKSIYESQLMQMDMIYSGILEEIYRDYRECKAGDPI